MKNEKWKMKERKKIENPNDYTNKPNEAERENQLKSQVIWWDRERFQGQGGGIDVRAAAEWPRPGARRGR